MKKRIISALFAIILIASAMGMTACAGTIYDELAKDGYTVKVIFDPSGGAINQTQDVTIVEVYNADNVVTRGGKTGIAIPKPDDKAKRGEGVFEVTKSDEKTLFYQVGWYTERELRVDENGQALDNFGVPVSESGREQGYVFSGLWDFDNDVVDPSTLENGELTLYAAWIPTFTYEFYFENESGEFVKIGSIDKFVLQYPKWNDRKGEFDMKDFPKVAGKVFESAYLDEAQTVVLEGNFDGREAFIDFENGIVESSTIKIYIKWAE